jgi:ParB family chromosome partitioning protein
VRVIEADDRLVEELALLENVQRQDLNIIEEAKAYRALLDRGWSRDDLARKMGFKQPWRIDERTSLLNLAPEYQDMVIQGKIGNSEAFEMSRLSYGKQGIVLKKILSGELNTYNKLRSFVDAVLAVEKQENIFALEIINDDERETIKGFDSLLNSTERVIREFYEQGKAGHLKKAGFRQDIKVEQLDLIIKGLMKIRKTLLAGAGLKDAVVQINQTI